MEFEIVEDKTNLIVNKATETMINLHVYTSNTHEYELKAMRQILVRSSFGLAGWCFVIIF